MANTLRIKRRPSSGSAGAPSPASSLYNGELAFNENDNILYYAYGSGVGGVATSVPAIAGSGAYSLRGGTNATGTWPISIDGNAAYTTNAVYTTGNQTVQGFKTFYGSGSAGSAVSIKSDSGYNPSLAFLEGGAAPKMMVYWDSADNKLKVKSGSAPATAFIFQVDTHLQLRATGTSSSVTQIPVFISNPDSSAQTIYTRTPNELKTDIGLSNVTNDIQVKQTTGGTTVGYLPTWNSTSGELLATGYAVSTNLVTNSGSTHIPRADSVVNYVASGLATHVHGNITNSGTIGSTANLPIITTTNGALTTGSFGSTANTFCQGNDSRLSDTRNTTNSLTINNGGAGDSSSFTFNGSAAKTISYNSIGAPSQTGALASGTNWNISILGNAATVTSGVYTSRSLTAGSGLVGGGDLSSNKTFDIGQGDGISVSADSIAVDSTVIRTTGAQTISSVKTFTNNVNISGTLGQYLLFRSSNAGNYGTIVFDGNNYDGATQSSYISSNTGVMTITHGNKISVDVANLEVKAANTTGNSVGYFAVFDSNPASSLTTLKSVSKDQILDDIGAATSGLTITAGSGLVGGGNLSANRTFDIGQGDGISVSADSISVNTTVVRTTGDQSIAGSKTFTEGLTVGNNVGNLLVGTSGVRFTHPEINFQIDAGNLSPGFDGDALRLDIDSENGTGYTTTLKSNAPSQNIIVRLPNTSGTLALDKRDMIAGSGLVGGGNLSADRTFNIGQGDGITVSADSIAVDSTVVRTTGTQSINGSKTFGNEITFTSGMIVSNQTANNLASFDSNKKLASIYSVETTLAGGTSSIPRADAVKTYVDNMIGSGIATNDAMIFKGAIDCSSNPNYPAADRGWTYKVSVAGKIGGASGTTVEVNDTLICTTDGTSAGTQAAVGSNWIILQTNITDASILVTGPTSATSGNIAMFNGSTGKIIQDGGFLVSNIARLDMSQTFAGTNSFGPINVGYQVSADAAFNVYDDDNMLGFQVLSGGSVTVGTWNATAIAANKGGTGQTSYAVGDLLYANTTSSLAKLADVATGNALLAGGVNTAPSWGKIGLTTHITGTLPVANGGTNQTSYTDGQLLIGNTTGNTLTKATLTAGTAVDITNGGGSITIGHNDTSTLTGAQGSNGIASFTVDGMGHVTAVTTATYLTAATVCAAIVDCTLDGGTF
jgi:hypothetical protein